MINFILSIFLLVFLHSCGLAQDINQQEVEVSLNAVHPKIKTLLSKNEKLIKSITRDSDGIIEIVYGDELLERQITFFQSDSIIEVDDYGLKVFLAINNSQLTILDTARIKEEIFFNTDEITVLQFNSKGLGKYTDYCLKNTSNDTSEFRMGIVLCDRSNIHSMETNIIWSYSKYVNIDDFIFNKDLKAYLAFFGANVGMKKTENPYPWVDRYRLLLFEIENSKLVSSIIVSGMR